MGTPLNVGAGPESSHSAQGSHVARADPEVLMLPPPQFRNDRCTSPRGWDPGSHTCSVSPVATELNAHHSRLYDQSYTCCSWLSPGLSLPSFFSVHPHTLTLPLAHSSPRSSGSLGEVHRPHPGAGLSLLLAICSDRNLSQARCPATGGFRSLIQGSSIKTHHPPSWGPEQLAGPQPFELLLHAAPQLPLSVCWPRPSLGPQHLTQLGFLTYGPGSPVPLPGRIL